jgi:nucleotide-binding universal stress UspA family protein
MRIVVGTDGSGAALAAAGWVAQLPLASDDEITIAAAVQRPVIYQAWSLARTPATAEVGQTMWQHAQQEAREAVAEAASLIEDQPGTVRMIVKEGHPIDVLGRITRESKADLLVLGPRGKGRLARILLGSVSHGLLESMPAPVLVARGTVAPPLNVVLATDGSAHSLAAARYLARFPLPDAARIHVLAVDDRARLPPIDDEESWASRAVAGAVDALGARGRSSVPAIEYGYPQQKILAAAKKLDCDLIVTGARGLGGFEGLVLGSVSRAVSTAARCSVLVVWRRSL